MYIRVCIVYKCTCCTLYSTLYCSIKVLAIRKIQNSWKSIEIKNLFNLIFTLRAYNFQMFVKFFSYILLLSEHFLRKNWNKLVAPITFVFPMESGFEVNITIFWCITASNRRPQTSFWIVYALLRKKSLKNQGNLTIDKRTSFFLLLLKLEKILKFEASSAVSSVQSKKIFSR